MVNTFNSNSVTVNGTTATLTYTNLPELSKGKAGEAVAFLQKFLYCYGYRYLTVDGQFGSQTEQAVMSFQQNYNQLGKSNPDYLLVDGTVGKETWRAISNILPDVGCGSLIPTNSNYSGINLPVLSEGKAGEAVRFLQKFLIGYGYTVTFDAQFGSQTKQAVMYFQSNHGLIADGVVGENTWQAIADTFCNYAC